MAASELWTSFEQENANNIRKWLYGTVLVRDWNPNGTTGLAGFSPFVGTGDLVTTLLSSSNPGGQWFDVGYLDDNGVDFTPKFQTDDVNVWQTRWAARTDAVKDGEDVMIVCAETNPVVDALYNNLPLASVVGQEAVGTTGYQVTTPTVPQIIYRQLLIIGVDAALTNAIYIAEIRPKVSLSKKEKRNFNAKKADFFGLTFECYIDSASGFAVSKEYGGPGWAGLGGVPILATPDLITITPPVLNTATILPSVLSGTPSASGGTLAAGTYYWTITALTAAGESVRGNEISATTTGTTSSNSLSWTAVSGATGYKIYRGTTAGGENVLVTTIGSGATVTYTDTGSAGTAAVPSATNNAALPAPTGLSVSLNTTGGQLPITQRFWVITALTAAGESTVSNEVNATPTNATSSASLSWTAVTGAIGYNIYRGTPSGGENHLVGYIPSGSTTTYVDTNAAVLATPLANHQVKLIWQAPISNNGPYTYTISQTTGGNTAPVTIVNAPTTTVTGEVSAIVGSLTAANVYTFVVSVADSAGTTATYPVTTAVTST